MPENAIKQKENPKQELFYIAARGIEKPPLTLDFDWKPRDFNLFAQMCEEGKRRDNEKLVLVSYKSEMDKLEKLVSLYKSNPEFGKVILEAILKKLDKEMDAFAEKKEKELVAPFYFDARRIENGGYYTFNEQGELVSLAKEEMRK